jgi:hypothetical protein
MFDPFFYLHADKYITEVLSVVGSSGKVLVTGVEQDQSLFESETISNLFGISFLNNKFFSSAISLLSKKSGVDKIAVLYSVSLCFFCRFFLCFAQ